MIRSRCPAFCQFADANGASCLRVEKEVHESVTLSSRDLHPRSRDLLESDLRWRFGVRLEERFWAASTRAADQKSAEAERNGCAQYPSHRHRRRALAAHPLVAERVAHAPPPLGVDAHQPVDHRDRPCGQPGATRIEAEDGARTRRPARRLLRQLLESPEARVRAVSSPSERPAGLRMRHG